MVRLLCIATVLLGSGVAFADVLEDGSELFRAGQYSEVLDVTADNDGTGTPGESVAVLRLRTLLTLGRYADAAAELDAALERFPRSVRLRWIGQEVVRFAGEPEQAETLREEIAAKLQTEGWRYQLDGENLIVLGQFLLEEGLDPKQVLDETYSRAQRYPRTRVDALLASGELAMAKDDFALAGDFFQQAAAEDADRPDVQFGLARAFENTPDADIAKYLNRALELNPRHVPSLVIVAERQIDREQYGEADETLKQVFAVNEKHPIGWALKAVLAHLRNEPKAERAAVAAALDSWATNPEVPYTIGRKLSRKYRFAEAAVYQRQALGFDADYLPAKLALSQDQLRLGEEQRGWELAGEVSEADPYNVLAYNLATLHDQLDRYTVLEDGRFLVRMDSKEADIFGPRVLELLNEAAKQLATKYAVELPERVFVDVYSRQEDFAIRTFGMPGGIGYLGVCFGPVVTMNSPSALTTSTSWESVLWHEFVHVVTLTKTRNRMPRWLSEGISVYEERLADPRWGQQMTPQFRSMLLGEGFVKLSELSKAFLTADSGEALQLAYFESSLAVEFLVEEFGFDALLAILDDLGEGLAINDAISRHTADTESLDEAFETFVTERCEQYANEADFTPPELEPRANDDALKKYVDEHPENLPARQRLLAAQIERGDTQAAIKNVDTILGYFGDVPPVELLVRKAALQRSLGKDEERLQTLRLIASRSADAVNVFTELMNTASESENDAAAIDHARDLLAVNPLVANPHEVLANAAERTGDLPSAIDALGAVSRLDPIDPAGVHYRIATLQRDVGNTAAARRRVLLSLAEAPRYRDAHRLLLELTGQEGEE